MHDSCRVFDTKKNKKKMSLVFVRWIKKNAKKITPSRYSRKGKKNRTTYS